MCLPPQGVEKRTERKGGTTMNQINQPNQTYSQPQTSAPITGFPAYTAEPKNQPEKKFRAGAVSATVWKNAGKGSQSNEQFEYRSVSFERSYKDPQGNWKTTSSLRMNDLPKALLVLEKAYEFIALSGAA